MQLLLNTIIYWIPNEENDAKTERLLAFGGQAELWFIDIFNDDWPVMRYKDEVENAINNGLAKILDEDPFGLPVIPKTRATDDSACIISIPYPDEVNKAYERIMPLIDDSSLPIMIGILKGRGEHIAIRANEIGCSRTTLYKDIKRFLKRGMSKVALNPDYGNCGNPGQEREPGEAKLGRPRKTGSVGRNVTKHDRHIFREAYKKYVVKEKLRLTKSYDKMNENFYAMGFKVKNKVITPILLPKDQRPTSRQYRYWVKKESKSVDNEAQRMGKKRFNLKGRSILHNAVSMARGPGSIYMIDSTQVDIYGRSRVNRRKIIERATLFALLDVFSTAIAGFYLTPEKPSVMTAMIALHNACMPKTEFCNNYSYPIDKEDWPCEGIPQSILGDRGEMASKLTTHLTDSPLNIRLSQTPPYRADEKGPLEKFFDVVREEVFMLLPGAVKKDHQRGDPDYRLKSALTIPELNKILISFIVYYNRHKYMEDYPLTEKMIQDGVEPYPLELWKWGIENDCGQLRTLPKDIIQLYLLLPGDGVITEKGLSFEGNYYTNERSIKEQWFEGARMFGRKKVPICYDPRNTSVIYLREEGTMHIEPFTISDRVAPAYIDKEWWEVESAKEDQAIRRDKRQGEGEQAKADFHSYLYSTGQNALSEREELMDGTESAAAQTKNIRANQNEEVEHHRKTSQLLLPGEEEKEPEQNKTEHDENTPNTRKR